MKLQFFGAARTVTGSCHLLEIAGKRILLDCGLFQGRRKESFERNRQQPFRAKSIDSVVLSHAHIDHSGNLPRLVAAGYRGRIYTTSATRDLAEWMLRDSGFIQEKDVEYVNRRRLKKGQKPFEPLYTQADAARALDHFRVVPYDEVREIEPGIQLRFQDAGHMLGSASCHLHWQEDGRQRTLVFTGDVGRGDRPILRDPVPPTKADILICESTYGDRLHPPGEDVEERLGEVVRTTFERGGKVLIPAFSVGRTQRLVYHLNSLFNQVKLPTLPIFVDSPLATNATRVFRDHPECYDDETRQLLHTDQDPFGFYRLTYVRDVEASKAINRLRSPCVIISASGMCEAGRVIHPPEARRPRPREHDSRGRLHGPAHPRTPDRRGREADQPLRGGVPAPRPGRNDEWAQWPRRPGGAARVPEPPGEAAGADLSRARRGGAVARVRGKAPPARLRAGRCAEARRELRGLAHESRQNERIRCGAMSRSIPRPVA